MEIRLDLAIVALMKNLNEESTRINKIIEEVSSDKDGATCDTDVLHAAYEVRRDIDMIIEDLYHGYVHLKEDQEDLNDCVNWRSIAKDC